MSNILTESAFSRLARYCLHIVSGIKIPCCACTDYVGTACGLLYLEKCYNKQINMSSFLRNIYTDPQLSLEKALCVCVNRVHSSPITSLKFVLRYGI